MTIMYGDDVVQRLLVERPSFHLSGTARWDALPATLRAIHRVVRPGSVTLEVGAGVSTVVFAAAGAQHTAISPDPEEHRLIREYCNEIGVDDSNLEFLVGLSDDVLPSYLTRERTLDVGMIDGAHSFPFPILDWYYVARALKVEGKLILDDVPVPAVMPIFRHMEQEPVWRLDGLLDRRAAEFTLLREPPTGDRWGDQAFNRRYPDYSYLHLPSRVLVTGEYRARTLRAAIGRRFPPVRRFYENHFRS